MSCSAARSPLRALLREASLSKDIPSFLVPALSTPSRKFSTSRPIRSRVGNAAISIPSEVSLRFYDLPKSKATSRNPDEPSSAVEVIGPLGQTTLALPPYLIAQHDTENNKVNISVQDASIRHQRAMWGTMRAHMQNTISGVSEGHICILRLVGVGYRATVDDTAVLTNQQPEYPGQKFVTLKLGYAHPIEMPVPKGVKATVPQPTRILLEGSDKQVVAEFAAKLRAWRKPEPYKGKGIFVNNETIRLKAKKIK